MREGKRRCHVSAKDGVLCVLLIINFCDRLQLILSCDHSVHKPSATVDSLRKCGCNVKRWFAILRRIDAVVDEWRLQCDLTSPITDGRGERRKVSCQSSSCGHKCSDRISVGTGSSTLISTEKEQPVFQNRTTECSPVLVTFERVTIHIEEISSIECVIANELKHVAMQIIRS